MPLNKIGDRILADGKAEAERLESKAKKNAAKIIDNAKISGDAHVREAVDRARRQALQEKKQKLAAAGLAARDNVIAAKQEIIDKAFADAGSMIEDFSEDDYLATLLGLITTNAVGGEEVIFDDTDRDIAKRVVDTANKSLAKKGVKAVSLASDGRKIGKGFVLRHGKVEESFAFSLLLKNARDDLEANIAAIIFGEPG